ncbi:MAG: calcineurin-like phosphoesterase C-terminal domain-containing protein [Alistipes sp.]|nr:calcineurin-like phosphoesterase C-terminal domain-containing protein [Candidatus Alistipes equi]
MTVFERHIIFFGAVALISFIILSCSSSGIDALDTTLYEITATIDNENFIDFGSGKKKEWSKGDKILLSDNIDTSVFSLKETLSNLEARFVGEMHPHSSVVGCFYPASKAYLKEGKLLTSIDSSVNVLLDDEPSCDYMLARTNGTRALFRSATALIRMKIYIGGGVNIDKVRIEFPVNIAGECTADFENGILCNGTNNNIILNFIPSRKDSVEANGIHIAPCSKEKLSSCVLLRVYTDESTYLIARKINNDLLAEHLYDIDIDLRKLRWVERLEELSDGCYTIVENEGLNLRLLDVSSSTLSVAWSEQMFPKDYSKELFLTHLISLYDSNRNLVLSVNPSNGQSLTGEPVYVYSTEDTNHPPRFVFSGLKPDRQYSVFAQNLSSGVVSQRMDVHTLSKMVKSPVEIASQNGDVIYSEDFSKFLWGGDPSTLSAGYVPKNLSMLSSLEEGRALGDISLNETKFLYTKHDEKIEPFISCPSLLESIGLGDFLWWIDDDSFSKATPVTIHAGLLGLRGLNKESGVLLPKLKGLVDSAEVVLKMKMRLFDASQQSPVVRVSLVDKVEEGEQFKALSFSSTSQKILTPKVQWQEVEVHLSGALSSSRILISVSSDALILLDDISIEFVKYLDESSDIPKVGKIASSPTTLTVEYVNAPTQSPCFTVELFLDKECTTPLQSYNVETSSREEYVKWPARFTFSLLHESTPYYIRITDRNGVKSSPIEFCTEKYSTKPKKCVLYECFDHTTLGGDYMNLSMGVNLNGVTPQTFLPSSDKELLEKFTPIQSTIDGPNVTSLSDVLRERMGLSSLWEYNHVSLRPGYLKVGDSSQGGYITTPFLTSLRSENSTVKVSFDACSFVGDSTQAGTPSLNLSILSKDGTVIRTEVVELQSRPEKPTWERHEIELSGLSFQNRIRFESSSHNNGRFLLDNILLTSEQALENGVVCGYIKDMSGRALEGISVSDGFSVTKSNDEGYWQLSPSPDCWYIYYSIPPQAIISQNEFGLPSFYEKYESLKRRYDFTLSMRNDIEQSFNLLCLADPQSGSSSSTSRFRNETIPFIRNFVSSSYLPCYGVTLGDIVSSSSSDTTAQFAPMRNLMAFSSAGLYIFQTMGNHDNTYFYGESNPLEADERSSSINLKAQRKFEEVMGPVNYSWNRAEAHIISMKDIMYNSQTAPSDYSGGFSDEQYEWLKADLELVPKQKLIILCVHIPFASYHKTGKNMSRVLELLSTFKNVHIMAGHTHYMRLEPSVGGSGIYEHTHSAVCGGWWASNLSTDGSPNGFAVYRIEGRKITNAFFQGVNNGMNSRDYQMRLYRGNMLTGGKHEYFRWSLSQNEILANVFFADSSWSVKVYEDGVYSGDMTRMTQKRYNDSQLPKSEPNSKSNPTLVPEDSSQDFWTIGYFVGVNGNKRSSYLSPDYHMYRYTLKNIKSKVVVIATDPYGNQYKSSTIESAVEDGYPYYVKSGNN